MARHICLYLGAYTSKIDHLSRVVVPTMTRFRTPVCDKARDLALPNMTPSPVFVGFVAVVLIEILH